MQSGFTMTAAALACALLLASTAFVRAAPAPEDATTAAPDTAAAPATPAPLTPPVGAFGQAIEHLFQEAPDRLKSLGDNFRKDAGALRERIQGGIAKVIQAPAALAKAKTSTTTATPLADNNKPPVGEDPAALEAAPTTPASARAVTTVVPPDSRTLIGAPTRCKANEELDQHKRCREVW